MINLLRDVDLTEFIKIISYACDCIKSVEFIYILNLFLMIFCVASKNTI